MLQIQQVITNDELNNFYQTLTQNYNIQDDLTIFKMLINIINTEIATYEIAYKDEDQQRFKDNYFNVLSSNYLEVLQRARFLRLTTEYLKDYDNWVAKEINNMQHTTGYSGFDAEGNFQKNTGQSESYTLNPVLFAQTFKDCFNEIIKKIIKEIKEYCLWFY